MTLAEQEKRKRMYAAVLGGFALVLVCYQGYNLFGGGTPSAPPAAPVIVTAKPGAGKSAGPAAVKLTSAQLDPTLHMEQMLVTESLVYGGTGRNIFSAQAEVKPVVMEQAKYTARVVTPPPPPPQPCPPNCPPPPPPPPINLKFFGTTTAVNGTRRAFLLNGDDVFIASAGDVVQRKYKVVSIAANSIVVEDLPNSNKQTLPLVQ